MLTRLKARLPIAAFVLIAALGSAGAVALWRGSERTDAIRFAAVVDEATNRIKERLRLHLMLIDATAAIFEAEGDHITAPRFARFFDSLRVGERNPGIAGLGFAPLVQPDEVPAVIRRLDADFRGPIDVWPESDAESGAEFVVPVFILGSPDPDTPAASGFDMYSDPTRRTAIEAAITTRSARATGPIKLATDAEPLPGFIIYAPVYADIFGNAGRSEAIGQPTGFAFGGFRIGQFVEAALNAFPYLAVAMTVADADAPEAVLYAYGEGATGLRHLRPEARDLNVAGQSWTLTFSPSDRFQPSQGRTLAVVFAGISVALAGATAMTLRAQARASAGAVALAGASQRSLGEKDLLLQEMTHRIKNVITRILAIARQTAARAGDLPSFTDSFTRRLQAMAEAQDMLSRSATATADLADLLSRELAQVFGEDFDPDRLRGPQIQLDATRTQALGLVFHELATNALKYGGASGGAPAIYVGWSVTGGPAAPALDLYWRERGGRISPPEQVGFGTKLIDASLRHELGGRVERNWTPEGLSLRMVVPLHTA